jgi:iron complex transport system substrate-binding protein
VVSSYSFTGQIYNLFGMVNIADQAPGAEFGYPELSDEYVVDADPEIIFLSFEAPVADRPGWGQLSAVVNDRVFLLDPDTSSRWGPRIVDFARDIAAALVALGGD